MDMIEKEFGKPKAFQQHAIIDPENKTIAIFLEDCSYHAEWIRGEGADIALYRANDDDRVVGAMLPLRQWTGRFAVDRKL